MFQIRRGEDFSRSIEPVASTPRNTGGFEIANITPTSTSTFTWSNVTRASNSDSFVWIRDPPAVTEPLDDTASDTSSWSEVDANSPGQLSLYPKVTEPLKDRAINLFLGTYVVTNPDTIWGFFGYVPAFLEGGIVSPNRKGNKAALAAVNAVSIAAYANSVESSSLMNQAFIELGRALRLLSAAVACSKEATEDSTYSILP